MKLIKDFNFWESRYHFSFILLITSIFFSPQLSSQQVNEDTQKLERAKLNFYLCVNLEDKENKCTCAAENTNRFQNNILEYEQDGEKLKDLLAKRNNLAAKYTVIKTLLDVWEDYQKYLDEGLFLTDKDNNPIKSIKDLRKLNSFIKDNASAVQKYHLTSEVINEIFLDNEMKVRDRLKSKSGLSQKIKFIKDKIKTRCEALENPNQLYMCRNNAWKGISFTQKWAVPDNTESDGLNRLVNAIAQVDDIDKFTTEEGKDLSQLFYDRPEEDITGMNDISEGLTGIINASINDCKEQLLDSSSEETQCFNRSLDEITENDPALKKQYQFLKENFKGISQNKYREPYTMKTLGGLIDAYTNIINKTHGVHEKASKGTANKLYELFREMGSANENLKLAAQNLNQPEKRKEIQGKLQEKFKDISKARLANLGRTLKRLDDKGKREGFLPEQEKKNSFDKNANQLINDVLNIDPPMAFFKNGGTNKELLLDDQFRALISSSKNSDQLKRLINPEDGPSLSEQIKDLDQKILAMKESPDINNFFAIQNYLYDKTRQFCLDEDFEDNEEVLRTSCTIEDGINVEFEKFLNLGNELIVMANKNEQEKALEDYKELCRKVKKEDPKKYLELYAKSGICFSILNPPLPDSGTTRVGSGSTASPRLNSEKAPTGSDSKAPPSLNSGTAPNGSDSKASPSLNSGTVLVSPDTKPPCSPEDSDSSEEAYTNIPSETAGTSIPSDGGESNIPVVTDPPSEGRPDQNIPDQNIPDQNIIRTATVDKNNESEKKENNDRSPTGKPSSRPTRIAYTDPNIIYDYNEDGKITGRYTLPKWYSPQQWAVPAAKAVSTIIPDLFENALFDQKMDYWRQQGIQQKDNWAYQKNMYNQYSQCGMNQNFFARNNCYTAVNTFYSPGMSTTQSWPSPPGYNYNSTTFPYPRPNGIFPPPL